MENKISTVLFDLGGVILNLDYGRTTNAFKEVGGVNFDRAYSQAQQNETFDLLETGKLSNSDFRNEIRDLLNVTLSDNEIDDAWNAMLLDLPKERIDFLFELKKKYRIYLFSNTNAIHYKAFKNEIKNEYGNEDLLEDIFHKTYYSHIFGYRKPNGIAFQKILAEQGLTPSEVLFIDDSAQHIEGAKSIGINAVHLVDVDMISCCKNYLFNES